MRKFRKMKWSPTLRILRIKDRVNLQSNGRETITTSMVSEVLELWVLFSVIGLTKIQYYMDFFRTMG
jgi:hypothetical protein